jgi:small subunit ribosomal protein S5
MADDMNQTKEDKKDPVKSPEKDTNFAASEAVAKSVYGEKRKMRRTGKNFNANDKKDEFDQRIIDLARVTRVMAGGKRMRFRACVAIGDKKGKVGLGMGKGADVTLAVNKAVSRAKKNMIEVPMIKETVPHEVLEKYGAAKVLLKPASSGRGVIAGGAVRIILELAGVKNAISKILGTNNKINNAQCTINALKRLKKVSHEHRAAEVKPAEKDSQSAKGQALKDAAKKVEKKK